MLKAQHKRIAPGPGELEALKKEYTPKQKQYIDSVEGRAHMSAVNIIGELEKYRMFFECCSCLSTIAKLSRSENVNTAVLEKICIVLDCQIGDIVEIKREEQK
jgi:hypothetical protein